MEEKKKKKTSGKTLKTAREAGYFGKKMLDNTRAAVMEGRPVAWSMVDWWVGGAIAKAMGVEMVYPENYGAFCAATQTAESNLEYAESDGFAGTLCGYARNCFGYARKLKENNFIIPADAPAGGMPKPTFLLGCGAACDARYKWFQALGRYLEVPVWMLEFPQTGMHEYFINGNKEDNINFMVAELRGFVSFLEKLLGKKMDWAILEEKTDIFYKTMVLANKVDELRKAVPTPALSTDFWSIMISHLYLPDDPDSLNFYKRIYEEIKERVDSKTGAIPNEMYRMLFSELPPWHSLGFFDEVAAKHGIAFVFESWVYHAPPLFPEEEKEKARDPLEFFARFSYHKFHNAAQTAKKFGMDPVFLATPFLEYAQEYKADGLMCHPLMSCRPATYTLMHLRNFLMEKLKVPSVIVEGDIVDRRVFNEEEAFSKMDAFVETMDFYREIRKKEGLNW
jgi:benzoyl-CoA reductase/2-hydroxyglutaryl-CoA dehydratase subunit BcrC/BadD/HgdB